jgi:hypothetical protein
VHGLRSTFTDWAAEAGYSQEMREIALAHAVGDSTERAYRRTDLLAKRREMMQEWSNYIAPPAGNFHADRLADDPDPPCTMTAEEARWRLRKFGPAKPASNDFDVVWHRGALRRCYGHARQYLYRHLGTVA